MIIHQVIGDEIRVQFVEEGVIATDQGLVHSLDDKLGRGRVRVRREVDAPAAPIGMLNRRGILVLREAVVGHGAGHHLGRHRQILLAVFRQHVGDLFLVLLRIDFGAHDGVHDLLGPGRFGLDHVLVHAHHTTRMVLPDVTGEAQHLAVGQQLAGGVERFGHDEGIDLLRGQRRRHVRWRHHLQIDFIRRQFFRLRLDHRG